MISNGIISASEAIHIAQNSEVILSSKDKLLNTVNDWIVDFANEGKYSVTFDQDIVEYKKKNFKWLANLLWAYNYDVRVHLIFKNGSFRSFDWEYARKNPEIVKDIQADDVESSEMFVSWG